MIEMLTNILAFSSTTVKYDDKVKITDIIFQ